MNQSQLVRDVVMESINGATSSLPYGIVIPVRLQSEADNEVFLDLVNSIAKSPVLGELLAKRVIRFCRGGDQPSNDQCSQVKALKESTVTKVSAVVSAPEKSVSQIQKMLITERTLNGIDPGELLVPSKAVVTPLAKELARKRGITIKKRC